MKDGSLQIPNAKLILGTVGHPTKQGWQGSNSCVLYGELKETIMHTMLFSSFSTFIWSEYAPGSRLILSGGLPTRTGPLQVQGQ